MAFSEFIELQEEIDCLSGMGEMPQFDPSKFYAWILNKLVLLNEKIKHYSRI